MPTPEFPPVEALVPHSGPMVLLSRVLHHDAAHTRCAAEVDRCGALRDTDGDLAPWMAIELMAQCVAVHAGLVGRAGGDRARAGLLLGARRVAFHASRLRRGQALVVEARHLWGRATGPVAFECSVADARSGALLVEGRLSCVVPEETPAGRSG